MVLTFHLRWDGTALTGTAGDEMMGKTQIQDGSVAGEAVSFVQVLRRGEMEIRIKYQGKIMGDKMDLTRSMERPLGGRGGGRGPGGGALEPDRVAGAAPVVPVEAWVDRSPSRRRGCPDRPGGLP